MNFTLVEKGRNTHAHGSRLIFFNNVEKNLSLEDMNTVIKSTVCIRKKSSMFLFVHRLITIPFDIDHWQLEPDRSDLRCLFHHCYLYW